MLIGVITMAYVQNTRYAHDVYVKVSTVQKKDKRSKSGFRTETVATMYRQNTQRTVYGKDNVVITYALLPTITVKYTKDYTDYTIISSNEDDTLQYFDKVADEIMKGNEQEWYSF
jgi:hypothetical protein